MTLANVIALYEKRLSGNTEIEYRLMCIDSKGVMRDFGLLGFARYSEGTIIPLDGDSYSLADSIDAHTLWSDGTLIVWEKVDGVSDETLDSVCENMALQARFPNVEHCVKGV